MSSAVLAFSPRVATEVWCSCSSVELSSIAGAKGRDGSEEDDEDGVAESAVGVVAVGDVAGAEDAGG